MNEAKELSLTTELMIDDPVHRVTPMTNTDNLSIHGNRLVGIAEEPLVFMK